MLAGCATLRRRGDAAFERRSFVEAAELYEQALQDDPKDDKARAGRARAREAALAELLEQAQQLRAAARASEARARLARFFRLRRLWLMPTPPALVAGVAREAAAAAGEIGAGVRPLLAADAPLAAEALLIAEHDVIDEPELVEARRALHADIAAAGRRRCEHYLAGPIDGDSPYWRSLVARYCDHFGKPTPAPPLPYVAAGLEIDGSISGVSAALGAALADRLRVALAGTPWHAPAAEARIAAGLRGVYKVTYERELVTLQAPWVERVAYSTLVPHRESHQVSRLETEHYTVQVPYTDYQSQSYSCGTSGSYRTCTRRHAVTRYRTDYRTRLVTRWHTEYRTVMRSETRYREVPRMFVYDAEQQRGTFALASALAVSLPPDGAPLEVPLARREVITAVNHDVTFEAAGVVPQQARLPGADAWLQASLDSVVTRLRQDLRQAWEERFCRRDAFTVEEAARCLHGRRPVAGAAVGLRAVAGAEADALAAFALK
jgi:hypothetical protein